MVDANGFIRYSHFGEGNYEETERMVQLLLKEAGRDIKSSVAADSDNIAYNQLSPETYLGSNRMEYLVNRGKVSNGQQNFTLVRTLPNNRFSFGGQWTIADESAESGEKASLLYRFNAEKVYMVLKKGTAMDGQIKVMIDGKPISAAAAGEDVINGVVTVKEDRLYEIIDLKNKTENHLLELQFMTPGIEAYTFTFG